ncbi:DUF5994 family protein [Streptomyces sp. NPDC002564]|uniref:DUF5994 family protein n=1 Tax=Streptomyces sp. NPDC002564 TaxID=3364649 RepID=UPI0036A238ED
MSATLYPTVPHAEPAPAPPVQLTLKSGAPGGLLDGAWWPRSRDLMAELPALVKVLDSSWGRITRIAVNPAHWPVVPRKIPVAGHVVRAGWFTPEIDPHKLMLFSYRSGRWDLLVVPPEVGAEAAARLMAAAAVRDGPPLTASMLMAADAEEHGVAPADQSVDSTQAWEYEGGASKAVPAQAVRLPGADHRTA